MRIFCTCESIYRSSTVICNNLVKYFKMCHTSTVFVRHLEREDNMKISFMYGNLAMPIQKFSFMRSKTELLDSALARIKSKIQVAMLQKVSKKRKKNIIDADQVLPELDIALYKNNAKVDVNTRNINAWTTDSEMKINEEAYPIVVNLPSVISISLPKSMMSNFPIYPKIILEFCTTEKSLFKWFRQVTKEDNSVEKADNIIPLKNDCWKLVGEGYFYIPQDSDVGCKLKVSCLPKSGDRLGIEAEAFSVNTVVSGPETCPFEDRHQYTEDFVGAGSLRVISYNILADLYADTDVAKQQLFPHCPSEFLNLDYRRQLYLKEIMGYKGDLVCLQEVDRKVFHEDLVPFFSSTGLQGVFNEKGGQVAEGLSCFYRDSKFKLMESHCIILSDAVKSEAVLKILHSKIIENDKLAERFMSRTTALQVTLLQSKDDSAKQILVGNTHLYFHPNSDNIRLLQATACILYLEDALKKQQQEDSSHRTTLILCGDFNSCPEFGVYKLYTEGILPSSCIDWKSNAEEVVDGMDLRHSLKLKSACGTPQYTNYTQGFNGCLDYIFYDTSLLEVTQIVPLPTHEQVIEHIALPNKVFPSDHIALISTLTWKR